MRALVIYPVLRLEPTETGSRFRVYWTVRGWKREPDGLLVAVARVSHWRAVPTAVGIVWHADGCTLGELEESLRGRPGLRVTSFRAEGGQR